MRKVVLLCFTISLSLAVLAQDAAVKEIQATAGKTAKNDGGTKIGKWTRGGIINLNINQGGYDNWLALGDADYSIGVNGYLNLFANQAWKGKRKGKEKNWTNSLDIFQAIQSVHDERTDESNFSKLDDRLDFLSRYSVQLQKKLGFATIANLRTQLYDTKDGSKKRVSGFFAPAIVTIAPGLEWKACEGFSVFVTPVALRWVFLTNGPYSIQINTKNPKPFGVNPDREVDFQPGAYAQFNLDKKLSKNIKLKSRLDLYSNYRNNPENVDVFFTNFLSMSVNKWINVGINLDMVYDDDIRQFGWDRTKPGLQYKHIIGVGFGARF
jgi:Protein of unknown function (DUF3078)